MCPHTSTTKDRPRERGIALIFVLLIVLLLLTLGAAAILMVGQVGDYEKNREWAMQAFAAAEGATNKSVWQMLKGASIDASNLAEGPVDASDASYAVKMSAIIEPTGSNTEFRIYARGRAGPDYRLTKFMRAYVKFDKTEAGRALVRQSFSFNSKIYYSALQDWQEITIDEIRDRALHSLNATDRADFTTWKTDWERDNQ